MYAVVTNVAVPDHVTVEMLRAAVAEVTAPGARSYNGFVKGTWTVAEDGRTGVGFAVFADEASARARLATLEVGGPGPGDVTILSAGLYEVLGEA